MASRSTVPMSISEIPAMMRCVGAGLPPFKHEDASEIADAHKHSGAARPVSE